MISRFYLRQSPLLLLILSGLAAAGPLAAQQTPQLGSAPVAPEQVTRAQVAVASTTYGGADDGLVVDISNREQSRIFYQTVYLASENVASGWTGNVAQDIPGTTTQAFRDAIALRINYYRAMAGIPAAITLSDTYNAEDQAAALMMSVNGQLSHSPPTSWIDYTAAGAQAAGNSNLYLGVNGPPAIDGYIEDPGDSNAALGHRRWILYPQTATMGSGDVDNSTSGQYDSANALWVLDGNYGTTRPATRDSFVSWPPPGYVPYTLVFPKWSFSYPDADFSQASVSMTTGGKTLTVVLEPLDNGYGENTLVWTPQGVTLSADNPKSSVPIEQQEPTFQVTVSNILIGGSPTSFSYDVTAFDPEQIVADQPPAFFTGETSLSNGAYYLAFSNGNYFGYYSFLSDPDYIYHFDLGYEYVLDAADGNSGVYFYDFASDDFFYTSPKFSFPYLYDFGLNSVLYYYPDPNNPGHYNTNGIRYFYVFSTGQIISK